MDGFIKSNLEIGKLWDFVWLVLVMLVL
jgi:hypothetical protein